MIRLRNRLVECVTALLYIAIVSSTFAEELRLMMTVMVGAGIAHMPDVGSRKPSDRVTVHKLYERAVFCTAAAIEHISGEPSHRLCCGSRL